MRELRKTDKVKILFVRPPERLWPIINESDNFLLPLTFPTLAAYIRREIPNLEIKIIDCLANRIGWKSLEKILAEEKPDIFCAGEQTIYMHESMRAAEIIRRVSPDTVIITGGYFHSFMVDYTFEHFPFVDYIVRFEGEVTFTELVKTLMDGGDVSKVKGIAYSDSGKVVKTEIRPVISDLNTLPMPAYDLMPVEKYSPFGLLWPNAITIESNRGCVYNCDFCSWAAMQNQSEMVDGKLTTQPRFRIKDPDVVLEQIDYLYNERGVRYLFWVDGTWNASHEWLDEFCTKLIKRNYKLGWWAFIRPSLMLEQEELGILEKMVKAGLRHCLFGGERGEEKEFDTIKKQADPSDLIKVTEILKKKYPQVFRQSTFLVGIPGETKESIKQLGHYTRKAVDVDFAAYHPLMPYPGTGLWETMQDGPSLEVKDFAKYDMFYPVFRTEELSREEISKQISNLYLAFILRQPWRYVARMFSPHKIRRRLHWWFAFSNTRVFIRDIFLAIVGKKKFSGFGGVNELWKPSWYNK
ncbi:MAG: radical SAM protein [Elusimicrobia bacterium]|nr:radical SAM protein [Elusimicrobiota bacterium]